MKTLQHGSKKLHSTVLNKRNLVFTAMYYLMGADSNFPTKI